MNVRSAYYFLVFVGLILSVAAKSVETQSTYQHQESSQSRPIVDRPAEVDLKMYLEILNEREKQLTLANKALLENANYSLVKIPLFMLKGALDGYLASKLIGAPQVGIAKATSQKLLTWLKAGGLEKMKSLGFRVGILGTTMASNAAVQQDYQWQYSIPIYGSAYSAYLWSDNLMHTPELIEKNGNEILAIRKEKFRVRTLLENSSN
ncbi:MAG: hypothetical protein ACKN9V_03175 [Pseudomonadota bacterium]